MKRLIWALLSTCALLMGCNTMEGFGQDVQKAGSSIEGAAKKK